MIRQNGTACEHCVLNFADKFVMQSIMQYLFVFGRSFQGHTGGIEHVSFDGNAVISASTDL